MSSKTSYFKTERFLKTANFNPSGSKCIVEGMCFKKGDTFSHSETEQVINSCNRYGDTDLSTIVVKGENDLTIWIEEKSATSSKSQNLKNFPVNEQLSVDSSLPTKTVVKKYRGREYEETVVDWAATQQTNQQKPRRKYRGQYID